MNRTAQLFSRNQRGLEYDIDSSTDRVIAGVRVSTNTHFLRFFPDTPFQPWIVPLSNKDIPPLYQKEQSLRALNLTGLEVNQQIISHTRDVVINAGKFKECPLTYHLEDCELYSLDAQGWVPAIFSHHELVTLDQNAIITLLDNRAAAERLMSVLQATSVSLMPSSVEGVEKRVLSAREVIERHEFLKSSLERLGLEMHIQGMTDYNREILPVYLPQLASRVEREASFLAEFHPNFSIMANASVKDMRAYRQKYAAAHSEFYRLIQKYDLESESLLPALLRFSLQPLKGTFDRKVLTIEEVIKPTYSASKVEGKLALPEYTYEMAYNAMMDLETIRQFSAPLRRNEEGYIKNASLVTSDRGMATAWSLMTPMLPRCSLDTGDIRYSFNLSAP